MREAAQGWTQGAVKQDTAALQRFLADDLQYAHAGGQLQTKDQYIAAVTKGPARYESFTFSDGGFQCLAILGSSALPRQSNLCFAQHIGNGRPQLVREVGGKLREPRKGIVQPLEHIIESDGEGLKLPRPVSRGHSLLQVSRSYAPKRPRHFSERSQAAFGDRDCDETRGQNTA